MSNLMETVPQRIRNIAISDGKRAALHYRATRKDDFETMDFSQLWEKTRRVAAAFYQLGLKQGDHVSLISDNRKEWLFCDLALMGMGVIDVPRGSDSNGQEISYIINHSDSETVILENYNQLIKIKNYIKDIKNLKNIILFDWSNEALNLFSKLNIISFENFLKTGEKQPNLCNQFEKSVNLGKKEDESTIIYTSGTTGKPKGVILTQYSFVFQLERIYSHIPIKPDHIMLSVLPIWHTFERICEYIILNQGASIAYSKPVGTIMLNDLKEKNPQWFISVPRIWESIYESIHLKVRKGSSTKKMFFYFFKTVGISWYRMKNLFDNKLPAITPVNSTANKLIAIFPIIILWPLKKLGDILVFSKLQALLGSHFFAGVSGGGAMPAHIDYFFQAAGITILEGYGLTETGPVLAVRKYSKPIIRTIGETLDEIDFKIIDKEGNTLPPGKKGKLLVKTPQTMKGYYKNDKATQQVLKNGWLDTGDLAIETFNNQALKIMGRAKETIVLLGGENIEPAMIETQLQGSKLISNVMIVGQDKKYLGALITAQIEGLKEAMKSEGYKWLDESELLHSEIAKNLINQEIQSIISSKNGFKSFEKVFKFCIIEKEFEPGVEMTQTLKLKRSTITKIYKKEINTLFK